MQKKIDLSSVERVILVASGKGGVGKSTVAANLAVGLANQGLRVGLLDADLYGPSVPTMFAAMERPRVRNQRIQPVKRYGVHLLSIGMLADAPKAFVWQGPLLRGVLKQFLRDTDWGELDILLIDLPPGTGEIHIALLNLIDVFGVVFVTTPQDIALSAVRRSISMFRQLGLPLLAIVENMAFYKCPHCGESSQMFPGNSGSDLANEFDIGTVTRLPLLPSVATSGDKGVPILVNQSIGNSDFSLSMDRVLTAVIAGVHSFSLDGLDQ